MIPDPVETAHREYQRITRELLRDTGTSGLSLDDYVLIRWPNGRTATGKVKHVAGVDGGSILVVGDDHGERLQRIADAARAYARARDTDPDGPEWYALAHLIGAP